MQQWSLDDALKLARALQPETRKYGYHLTVGGGVLNKGYSDKDLDLYFLPMHNEAVFPKVSPSDLLDWLASMWGKYTSLGDEYKDSHAEPQMPRVNAMDVGEIRWNADPPPAAPPAAVRAAAGGPRGGFEIRGDGRMFYGGSELIKKSAVTSSRGYTYRVKFIRGGHDRVDVFIL